MTDGASPATPTKSKSSWNLFKTESPGPSSRKLPDSQLPEALAVAASEIAAKARSLAEKERNLEERLASVGTELAERAKASAELERQLQARERVIAEKEAELSTFDERKRVLVENETVFALAKKGLGAAQEQLDKRSNALDKRLEEFEETEKVREARVRELAEKEAATKLEAEKTAGRLRELAERELLVSEREKHALAREAAVTTLEKAQRDGLKEKELLMEKAFNVREAALKERERVLRELEAARSAEPAVTVVTKPSENEASLTAREQSLLERQGKVLDLEEKLRAKGHSLQNREDSLAALEASLRQRENELEARSKAVADSEKALAEKEHAFKTQLTSAFSETLREYEEKMEKAAADGKKAVPAAESLRSGSHSFEQRIRKMFDLPDTEALLDIHAYETGRIMIFTSYTCIDERPAGSAGSIGKPRRFRLAYSDILKISKVSMTLSRLLGTEQKTVLVLAVKDRGNLRIEGVFDPQAVINDIVGVASSFKMVIPVE